MKVSFKVKSFLKPLFIHFLHLGFGYTLIKEANLKKLLELNTSLQNAHTSLQNAHTSLQNAHTSLQNAHTSLQNAKSASEFELQEEKQKIKYLSLLDKAGVSGDLMNFCAANLVNSNSQILQDLLAGYLVGTHGYFCEFGASNGIELSNTFFLESHCEWEGIVVEPAKYWHQDLFKNRKCTIVTKCVDSSSGLSISFEESTDPLLSTIKEYSLSGIHAFNRKVRDLYEVETTSLLDLLVENNAPTHIDFLSIDTEGSEYRILSSFDFTKFTFGLICVEHNFGTDRERIQKLLEDAGYLHVLKSVSQWDDWYVSRHLQQKLFE